MCEYTIYLQEGLKSEILLNTDSYNEADDFLFKKWHEIEGNQNLLLLGNGGFSSTRYALKGNPLNAWEENRMKNLASVNDDISRNGDLTLIVRGLVTEFERNGRKFVKIKEC